MTLTRSFLQQLVTPLMIATLVVAPPSLASWAGGPWPTVVPNPAPSEIVVEDVAYVSSGLVIFAQICRPASGAAGRIILRQHGGFEGLAKVELKDGVEVLDRHWYVDSFCVERAREGYVVASSAYRGQPLIFDANPSNGTSHHGLSQGQVELCRGEVDDTLALLTALSQQPYVTKVGGQVPFLAWGESHGGCISQRLALRNPPGLRAVVDFYGPADMADLWRYFDHQLANNQPPESSPNRYPGSPGCPDSPFVDPAACTYGHTRIKNELETACGGTPGTSAAAYAERTYWNSPLFAQAPAPRMLIQGTDDWLIPYNQACMKRLGLAYGGRAPITYCFERNGEFAAVGADGQPAACQEYCGGGYHNASGEWYGGDTYLLMYRDQGHAFEPWAWSTAVLRAWVFGKVKLDL